MNRSSWVARLGKEIMSKTYSERGFALYDEVEDTYGHTVRVYESSAASDDFMWLGIDGEAIAVEGAEIKQVGQSTTRVVEVHQAAHLTWESAVRVRDQIDEWLNDNPRPDPIAIE